MNLLDVVWHLGNFLAPAWFVAALMALGLKLLWRRELKALAWRRLALWGALGGCLGLVAALLLLGRDGKMLGYGLMIVAIALPQWGLTLRR